MVIFLKVLLFLFVSVEMGYANKKVAITFDDLPAVTNEDVSIQLDLNKRIVDVLIKNKIPVTGFVCEGKLFPEKNYKKIDILKMWIDGGFDLANHTYSHKSLNTTPLEEYKADVLKGEIISKDLMKQAGREQQYNFFRYPFLETGTSKDITENFEEFLKQKGYTVAPVSLNTEDWRFNQLFIDNPQDKEKIINEYLESTRATLRAHTKFKSVWLLHVNTINSYVLEEIIKIAKEEGYSFISLKDALD